MSGTDLAILFSNGVTDPRMMYLNPISGDYFIFEGTQAMVYPASFNGPFLTTSEGVYAWLDDGSIIFTSFRGGNMQIIASLPRTPDFFEGGSQWDSLYALPNGSFIVHQSAGLTAYLLTPDGTLSPFTLPTPAFSMTTEYGQIGAVGFRPSDGAVSLVIGDLSRWAMTELFVPQVGATPGLYTPANMGANGFLSGGVLISSAAWDDRVSEGYVYLSRRNEVVYPLGGFSVKQLSVDTFMGFSVNYYTYAYTPTAPNAQGYTNLSSTGFGSEPVDISPAVLDAIANDLDNTDLYANVFFGEYNPPAPIPVPPFWTDPKQALEYIEDLT